jgi:hypothetical protein
MKLQHMQVTSVLAGNKSRLFPLNESADNVRKYFGVFPQGVLRDKNGKAVEILTSNGPFTLDIDNDRLPDHLIPVKKRSSQNPFSPENPPITGTQVKKQKRASNGKTETNHKSSSSEIVGSDTEFIDLNLSIPKVPRKRLLRSSFQNGKKKTEKKTPETTDRGRTRKRTTDYTQPKSSSTTSEKEESKKLKTTNQRKRFKRNLADDSPTPPPPIRKETTTVETKEEKVEPASKIESLQTSLSVLPVVRSIAELPIDEETTTVICEVEKIVARRITAEGKKEYFIKWLNLPDSESSWEPEHHLSEVLVQIYDSQHPALVPESNSKK